MRGKAKTSHTPVRPLLLGGLIVALAAAPLAFHQVRRSTLSARIAAAEAELGVDHGPSETIEELELAVADLEAELGDSRHDVPDEPELAEALRGVSEALQAFEVADQSRETPEVRVYERFSVIPINVSFRGGFLDAYGVIAAIEEMPRLMRIDRMTVRRSGDDGPPSNEVRLELSTFYTRGEGGGS